MRQGFFKEYGLLFRQSAEEGCSISAMEQKTEALVRETIRMAWPAVLESVFIQLAGMIDTLMVSALGTYAVSAVGLTVQPKFIALALFISTSIAVSALVARRRGQEKLF